jgi:spore coat polysaccharide biosynthesis protein SpsF (cytidylyltransferase family)
VLRAGVRDGHLGAQAALHAHLETVRTARAVAATCKHTDNAIIQATATASSFMLRKGSLKQAKSPRVPKTQQVHAPP